MGNESPEIRGFKSPGVGERQLRLARGALIKGKKRTRGKKEKTICSRMGCSDGWGRFGEENIFERKDNRMVGKTKNC